MILLFFKIFNCTDVTYIIVSTMQMPSKNDLRVYNVYEEEVSLSREKTNSSIPAPFLILQAPMHVQEQAG